MLAEWYLPPGECQVILPIKEGTISISHPAFLSSRTRNSQTPSPQVDTPNVCRLTRFADQEVWDCGFPRCQHQERSGLHPPGGGTTDERFASCPPAHSGFCHHREPATHLGRERSGCHD